MDGITILIWLVVVFCLGWLTHWLQTWGQRRLIKKYESMLAEIDMQLGPIRQRRPRR